MMDTITIVVSVVFFLVSIYFLYEVFTKRPISLWIVIYVGFMTAWLLLMGFVSSPIFFVVAVAVGVEFPFYVMARRVRRQQIDGTFVAHAFWDQLNPTERPSRPQSPDT